MFQRFIFIINHYIFFFIIICRLNFYTNTHGHMIEINLRDELFLKLVYAKIIYIKKFLKHFKLKKFTHFSFLFSLSTNYSKLFNFYLICH